MRHPERGHEPINHVHAARHVRTHDLDLRRFEHALLQQDLVRDPDLADIVQRRGEQQMLEELVVDPTQIDATPADTILV